MRRNVDLLAIGLVLVMIVVASEARKAANATETRALLVELTDRPGGFFSSTFDLSTLCVTRD